MSEPNEDAFGLPPGAIDIRKEYDPEFLRHLRQPRPRDQPPDLPESFFTFEDALEDLMHVSSYGEVLDIHQLASNRLLLRYKYPHGEPSLDQMARWSRMGGYKIRRHLSVLNGPVGAHLTPDGQGHFSLAVIDPQAFTLAQGLGAFGLAGLSDAFRTGSPNFPRHETELAEKTASNSSSSWWPSPFDTLWSMVGRGGQSEEGFGPPGGSRYTSSSESTRVNIDENGTTEEKVTEHKDEKGRRIKVILERKLDPEGNVISETTRRFEDGKEKDVYDDLS